MSASTSQDSSKRKWKPLYLRLPRHAYEGKLIVFEGIDGSGKSTQIRRLKEYLEGGGYNCLLISAPSSHMREYWAWRQWHAQPDKRDVIDEFGLTIMALGDRLILQQSVIIPALSKGTIVISDRYALSVLTYWSTPVHKYVLKHLLAPDLGIYCRVAPDVATQRLEKRNEEHPKLRNPKLLRSCLKS